MKFYSKILFLFAFFGFISCDKILQKPSIIEHPSNAYGLSLQRITLRCIVEGNPVPKIVWYKGNSIVESYKDKPATSNRQVTDNELIFLHLDTQDEGVYQCNASNSKGFVMSNNASVRIAYLNKNIIGPENKVASVGETISLECRPPRGVPEPKILWKMNGRLLETNKRIKIMPNGDLRIDKTSRSDSGRYNCIAKNFAFERESESALLTVRQKPQFKIAPSNIEVKVNEAAVLACSVEGDPRPSIVWRRDNDKHIASSRASLVDDRGLRIARVQLSDAGGYVCQASNSAGTIEAVARLTVISAPGFLETPESQQVKVGESVKFVCQISGSPRPTVVWVHNGRHFIADDDLAQEGERIRASKDGSLVITSVKISDAGKYECKASSYTGTIQSSAILTVLDSEHYLAPVIDIGPQNQTLRVGLTATFHCQTVQQEDVNIFWLKNGALLNGISDPRIIQLTSGTLKINLLRHSDSGNYTCKAERNNAYTTWSVTLRVLDKHDLETAILQTTDDLRMFPPTPTNVEVVERGDSYIMIKWESSSSQDSENNINHFLVESSPYESKHGWYTHNVVFSSPAKITNLRHNTGYRFLLRSVNDFAIGRPFVIPFVVFTTKKQPYSMLSYNELKTKVENVFCDNLKLKSVSTDQITVVWHVGGTNLALKLLSGFVALYKRVPLSRCLANNKDGFMEHCSLGENLLNQIEIDMNNPKSIFNEEGQEETKLIPMSDWNDRTAAYTIISGLKPFVCYELYVKPYLDHPKFGRLTGTHSKAKTVLTYDSVPTKSPTDVTARWLSNTSVEISWKPVPKQHINGILKGYSLHIIGNDTNSTRSIEVSPKSTAVRVQDLILHMPYIIHIAASTCQGEGIRSAGLVLTASSNIITMSPNVYGARSGSESEKSIQIPVAKQPWFISIMVVGGCLWVMICVFIVVVCRGIYLRGLIYKSGYSNGTKLISTSNSQIPSGSSNSRLGGHQAMIHTNTYNESNSSGLYKDTLILQPLMSTTTNSATINESKTEIGDNITNSLSGNNNSSNNNNQRRFQDSISSNGSSKSSTNQQRANNNNSNISSNNVAPYASASLLQQVIGISTKNNIKNYNYPINNPSTHRNILMPFSDSNLSSMKQDMSNSQSYPLSVMDWGANIPNKSEKIGQTIMLNFGHAIPPPPQFPPPPAPVSPTASNSTYYLQQDHIGDDGSYASCPIDVPISGASTTISPVPGYLWSAKHNGLVPVPGYIDYSCIPYNMISMARNSDTCSIASSFALPPPHDMMSMTQFSDDLYNQGSNGTTQILPNGMINEVLPSMMSSHMSNGSNMTNVHGGSGSSAVISGGSSRDYNKYDGASRSGHNEDSNSALEEEDDEEDDDKSEEDCDEDSNRCRKLTNSEQINGWQSPRIIPTSLMNPLTSRGSNLLVRGPLYFSQAHYPIEEATYDTCAEDQQPLFISQNYFPQNGHPDFFPPPPNGSIAFFPSVQYNDQISNCYDNPPPPSNTGPLNNGGLNPFVGCIYLGETPIV